MDCFSLQIQDVQLNCINTANWGCAFLHTAAFGSSSDLAFPFESLGSLPRFLHCKILCEGFVANDFIVAAAARNLDMLCIALSPQLLSWIAEALVF